MMPRSAHSGYTVFEMLVVLGILAILLATTASRMTGPSTQLKADALGANLVAQAVATRLDAMGRGEAQMFVPDLPKGAAIIPCGASATLPEILFLRSGQVEGDALCIAEAERVLTLRFDWLTGQARVAE